VTPLLVAVALAAGSGAPPPDLDDARIAWRYFERNTDPNTGLVRSVDGYPSTTGWELGSSLIAIVAAHELGIIPEEELDRRLAPILATLERLPLFRGALPNKAYDTRSGAMVDYANRPAPSGIGYSGVDLGRLASALVLVGELYPLRRAEVARVLARWDTCRVVRGGELRGVQVDRAGNAHDNQEGRLGYEQYAAKAFAALGRDVSAARRYDRFAADVAILGVAVPRDRRDARTYGAVDAVVTEPWALDAFEYGDPEAAPLAQRVFDVQKRRWERTGKVTALTEDHVDRPPWFVYDAIWADGQAWRTVTPEGNEVSGLRGVSTKAALSLAALHRDDPYSEVLRRAVRPARDPERGWFAGVYEDGSLNRSLNANTNGVVLEAALFAARGPLHRAAVARPGAGEWLGELARGGRVCVASADLAPGAAGSGDGMSSPGFAGLRRPERHVFASGSVFFDYRGADRGGAGALATVYPRGFWFLRIGGETTPWSPNGSSRFLWGFGYDDWHDGTFSATVHNWGPVRPYDAPDTGKAELNLGYKVPRACAGQLCLAAFPSVTVPFEGGPYVGARLTLTLSGKWFAMGGLGWTVPGVFTPPAGTPQWRVFYGFGRRDWKPGSLYVTYYDWGPNERARNGVLAVGIDWQF
jgi:hypothetical protein